MWVVVSIVSSIKECVSLNEMFTRFSLQSPLFGSWNHNITCQNYIGRFSKVSRIVFSLCPHGMQSFSSVETIFRKVLPLSLIANAKKVSSGSAKLFSTKNFLHTMSLVVFHERNNEV